MVRVWMKLGCEAPVLEIATQCHSKKRVVLAIGEVSEASAIGEHLGDLWLQLRVSTEAAGVVDPSNHAWDHTEVVSSASQWCLTALEPAHKRRSHPSQATSRYLQKLMDR